jgi:predicted nucleic acid-binding protein
MVFDTSVVIELLNGRRAVMERMGTLTGIPSLSSIVQVELEGGIGRHEPDAALWRQRLDILMEMFVSLPFDQRCARAYGEIISACGFNRRKVTDRMIAATALVEGLPLVTLNIRDCIEIPGIELVDWSGG